MINKYIKNILMEQAGEAGQDGGVGGAAIDNPSAPDGENKAWYENAGVSTELLGDEKFTGYLSRYASPEEALKGGFEARQALSKKIEDGGYIQLPGENATEAERSEFFKKLGRPETPDQYSWKPKEGIEIDPKVFAESAEVLHKAGINDAQHQVLMDMHVAELQRIQESIQNEQAEIASKSEQALRAEWKDDYDANIQQAVKVAEKYGVIDALKESGVINNFGIIKMLHDVAVSTREGTVKVADGFSSASDERASLKKHKAYADKTHPDHRKIMQRIVELSDLS